MWQPEGDKLPNPDRLGNMQPNNILAESGGLKLFTCLDQNDDLQLAYQCAQEGLTARLIVVPISEEQVDQIAAGTLGIREALTQARTFVADVEMGKVTAAWKTTLAKIPDGMLPRPGTMVPPVPMAMAMDDPSANVPMAAPVQPVKPAAPVAAAPARPVATAAPQRPQAAAPPPAAPAVKPQAAPAAPVKPMGKSGRINIERMTHRNSIAVPGETAITYYLVKLIPSGEPGKSPPLNLALVLDISGSMFAEDGTGTSRLSRVQQAAKLAIAKLRPEDTLAIVLFAYDAKVVLPPTSAGEKAKIEDAIDRFDQFGVDPGGTAMDEGIKLALEAVEKLTTPQKLSQIVVLTDGETTGETMCRKLAEQAVVKNIHLSVMGIGTEWNATLIKDLAKLSNGKWYYIDVTLADDVERAVVEEFRSLSAAGFLNVEMHVRSVKSVTIKRIRQVAPEIRTLVLATPEERHNVAQLGTLERDNSSKYIIDMSVPKRPDGKYAVAQLEVSFDPGTGIREGLTVPLEMTYTSAGHGYINAEVAKHIDEVQVAELNENLQKAINMDNKAEVQKVAEALVKKGEVMGKAGAKKTMLAKQVLQEINAGGRVSKKTQLAMDDAARVAADIA